jgi:hypothetical protein
VLAQSADITAHRQWDEDARCAALAEWRQQEDAATTRSLEVEAAMIRCHDAALRAMTATHHDQLDYFAKNMKFYVHADNALHTTALVEEQLRKDAADGKNWRDSQTT